MSTRQRRQSRRFVFEHLEPRQLLAADGMFFSATTTTEEAIDLAWDGSDLIVRDGVVSDAFGTPIVYNDVRVEGIGGEVITMDAAQVTAVLLEGPTPGANDVIKGAGEPRRLLQGLIERLGAPDNFVISSVTFESVTLAAGTGLVTTPVNQLYRPGIARLAAISSTPSVDESVSLFVDTRLLIESPLVDKEGEFELQIDYGDGTIVNRTLAGAEAFAAALNDSHAYSEPGEYTITVSGIAPLKDGGGVAIRSACTTVEVLGKVAVNDTSRDDTIVLDNENGQLRVTRNGVVEVLGNSEEIGLVLVQLGRGNDSLDASGLLATQRVEVQAGGLSGEMNTIVGGPADDIILGSRAIEIVFGGLGNDFVALNRGEDTVDAGGGDDVIAVLNSFGFGTPFADEENRIDGGEGRDTLRIEDLDGLLELFALTSSDPDYEGLLNFTFGVGSSAPGFLAFVQDLEEVLINPQTRRLNLNASNIDYLETFTVFGGPENDRVNYTNSTFNSYTSLAGGNDELLGGQAMDIVDGGTGDDNLNGNGGPDILIDYMGTNTLNGGAENDTYGMRNPAVEGAAFFN